MRYIVHAYDPTDDEALSRRMAVRAGHLKGAAELKTAGHFILGGALLSPEGTMIGSMMLLDFDTVDQLQDWIDHEPYIQHGIWATYDIKPFRQADV